MIFLMLVSQWNFHTNRVQVVTLDVHDVDVEVVGVVSHRAVWLNEVSREASALSFVIKEDVLPPSSVFNQHRNPQVFHFFPELFRVEEVP
jgi:hypothetical protein